MCGIAALIRLGGTAIALETLERMTAAVAHRGPDGEGTAYFAAGNAGLQVVDPHTVLDWQVALGHRRLSIIDLSDAGRQPMAYRDRLWLTYNGEVYNYVELRRELEQIGHTLRSQTDSEVILAAYEQWGTDCFARFHGMWGLVLVDTRRRIAILGRDRLGIKPLYVARTDGLLAVASEIKQFQFVPGLALKPDAAALRDYLFTGYQRSERTLFEGIAPLPPGTWQTVDLSTGKFSEPQSYWFPERIAPSITDADEAGRLTRESLLQAVRIHLRSDVPVGCALSGGLDSSAIAGCVALVGQACGLTTGLEAFSVLFPDTPIDETPFVNAVVQSLHCRPHSITPSAGTFLADLDRFLWIHDEPVGSLAQYAGYTLARLMRDNGVPVTLNGQGGDEVLGGYWQSYFLHLRRLARGGRWLRLAGHLGGAISPWGNRELARQIPFMLRRYRERRAAAQEATARGENNGSTPADSSEGRLDRLLELDDQQRRVFEIREMFLPRLLKWDDRNFMAFAVEGRYPLLDHRFIELALSFAPQALYRRGWTKEPLRRGLRGMLPQSILRRRSKFGFETPQDAWLCGPLRRTLEEWLVGDAPIWDYFSRERAGQLAAEVWSLAGRREEPGQALLRLYLADRWLRVFFAETGRQREVAQLCPSHP